jgi:hypothetical protein
MEFQERIRENEGWGGREGGGGWARHTFPTPKKKEEGHVALRASPHPRHPRPPPSVVGSI